MYAKYIKRPMDLFLALLAFIVLLPFILVLGIIVRLKLGSPVIFRQERPGKYGETFALYKFRTMTDARDEDGILLPDELRLTKFGSFLRRCSLDELPELWNIIRGDMSVVGPRPLLVRYLPLYNEHQRRRLEVRPGLSGYAQISGRNSISWEDKFDLDVRYVDNITFAGDMRIIFLTIISVVRREGISSATSATMEYFEGTSAEKMRETAVK